jgi:hypothetical protein
MHPIACSNCGDFCLQADESNATKKAIKVQMENFEQALSKRQGSNGDDSRLQEVLSAVRFKTPLSAPACSCILSSVITVACLMCRLFSDAMLSEVSIPALFSNA